jgi:hypothetical protein
MSVRTLWKGWPLQNEKDTMSRVRAGDAGAPATLAKLLAHRKRKENSTLGRFNTLAGICSG